MDDGKVTTEATCTTEGIKTYSCTTCGEVLKTESIATLNHRSYTTIGKVEPTCTSPGYYRLKCTLCGKNFTAGHEKALGHSLDSGTVTTAATCTTTGTITYSCTREGCNYTETDTIAIDPNNHTGEIKTTYTYVGGNPFPLHHVVKRYSCCNSINDEYDENCDANGAFGCGQCGQNNNDDFWGGDIL